MKKILIPSLLAVLVSAGLVWAQATGNITRAVQLAQGPGEVGYDTSGNVYFPRKILVPRTTTPTLATCGTSPSVVGNDVAGKITTGGTDTTCVMTFTQAYAVAPACVVSAQGTATQPTFTTTTTTLNMSVNIASTVYNYICISQG